MGKLFSWKGKNNGKEINFGWRILFPLTMCVITFIVGGFLAFYSPGTPLKGLIIKILISYFPFALILIFTFLCYKFKEKKNFLCTCKVIIKIISFFLILYYFCALFFIVLVECLNPVVNPRYYQFYASQLNVDDVFINNIPNSAESVNFFYIPGIMQGGTVFYLYYVDKSMSKEKMDLFYENKSIWVGYESNYHEKRGLLKDIISFTPISDESDFIIYLIDGNCDDSGYCNHGHFKLVAYNEKTCEVLYKFESW